MINKNYFSNYYCVGESFKFDSKTLELNVNYDLSDFLKLSYSKKGIRVVFKKENHKEIDIYRMKVIKNKREIEICSNTERGRYYAFQALNEIVSIKNEKTYLPIFMLEDGPSFNIRGIIEGFYGEPWSFKDRLDVIDFMKEYRMNSYMYAPKDDEYHRNLWRVLYDKDSFSKLKLLKEKCDKELVDFYYCISPGKDFEYINEEDFGYLFKKLEQLICIGVTNFALLMDDIDYDLKGENLEVFKTPGVAHSYITNRVDKYLKNKLSNYNLIMCPTEYWQNYDTEYRKDIKENMNEDVMVFWTGFNVIAEIIPDKDGEVVKESFGHDLVLWDNYPVNDLNKDRLFMGPLINRGRKLSETNVGMVSNPMIQWNMSKVALITMAHYMWNSQRYNSDEAWGYAIKDLSGEYYDEFMFFCRINRVSLIDYYKFEELEQSILNKDINYLDNYFNKTRDLEESLKKIFNKGIIEQISGWLERINLDCELWLNIKDKNISEIEKYISEIQKCPYTIGTNAALKIAKAWGYVDIEIERNKRKNNWENF